MSNAMSYFKMLGKGNKWRNQECFQIQLSWLIVRCYNDQKPHADLFVFDMHIHASFVHTAKSYISKDIMSVRKSDAIISIYCNSTVGIK